MAYIKLRSRLALPGLFVALLLAPLCSARAAPAGSLYTRLGGAETVTAIVNELIESVSTDPHLKRSFDKDVSIPRIKKLLAEQICHITGGGCVYTGDSMHDVHAGLGINQAEFYGMVETLREIMRKHNIGLVERNELLEILAPMKRDVVEH
jgi:hemoglobin